MSFLSNERIPTSLALSLSAGTTSWESVPYFDRMFYETGARGGSLPPESETSFDPDEHDNPTQLEEAEWEKQVLMYSEALDGAAIAAGVAIVAPEVEAPDPALAALIGGPTEEAFPREPALV